MLARGPHNPPRRAELHTATSSAEVARRALSIELTACEPLLGKAEGTMADGTTMAERTMAEGGGAPIAGVPPVPAAGGGAVGNAQVRARCPIPRVLAVPDGYIEGM